MTKNSPLLSKTQYILILGDGLVLTLVTIFGFATHGTVGTAGTRMLTTWIPLLIGWGLFAPLLQVFDLERAADWRQLWRPFWAMVLAGPFVGFLRAVILGQGVAPLFVVILGGFSALALLAWRAVYWVFTRKKKVQHG